MGLWFCLSIIACSAAGVVNPQPCFPGFSFFPFQNHILPCYPARVKRWALITGASQGIGLEFAKLFAAEGWNVALLARDEARLNLIADELRARHGVETKVVVKDLSRMNAAREVFDAMQTANITVNALVNNAGFGFQGAFDEIDLQKHSDLVQVNITSLVDLTHLFLKPMLERREGRILNVASTAAFQPGPYMAMYYASKAFVYSFSCALAHEVKGTGVSVTTLNPGMTRSEFHARAHMKRSGFPMMNADEVAKMGYRAMMSGRSIVTAGVFNKIMTVLAKATPTRLITPVAARINK